MKNWLKENKFIVILLVVILGFAFYWYEWWPAQIRKECYEYSKTGGGFFRGFNKIENSQKEAVLYEACLREKGLEK